MSTWYTTWDTYAVFILPWGVFHPGYQCRPSEFVFDPSVAIRRPAWASDTTYVPLIRVVVCQPDGQFFRHYVYVKTSWRLRALPAKLKPDSADDHKNCTLPYLR